MMCGFVASTDHVTYFVMGFRILRIKAKFRRYVVVVCLGRYKPDRDGFSVIVIKQQTKPNCLLRFSSIYLSHYNG